MSSYADWDRIEIEYRANKLSNREIGKSYGVSEAAIRKRAKKYNWQRDLANEVHRRTTEKLVRDTVKDRPEPVSDEQVVEEVATRNATVVESHRKDIRNGRDLTAMMMAELHDNTKEFKTLQELVSQQADDEEWHQQRLQRVQKAISLPQRAATMRDLSTVMKNLQTLERTAYSIDGREGDGEAGSLEQALLKGIQRAQEKGE